MLLQFFLILTGSAYFGLFCGHWLCVTVQPMSVSIRPLRFVHWCYLSLGACYVGIGFIGG